MLIISTRYGRLGNQLIVSSHAIASRIDNGHGLLNPAFSAYAEYFEGTVHNPTCGYPSPRFGAKIPKVLRQKIFRADLIPKICERIPFVKNTLGRNIEEVAAPKDGRCISFRDPEFATKLTNKVVFTDGWRLCNKTGTVVHRSEILKYFTPIATYREQVERTMSIARDGSEIVVGIHIRQDDLRSIPEHWSWLFETSDYVFYMQQMDRIFPGKKVRFVVCSDETQPMEQFEGLSVIPGPGSMVGDLYALAACDYIVASLSTFAKWASYYGDVPLYVIKSKGQQMSLNDFTVADLAYGCPPTE